VQQPADAVADRSELMRRPGDRCHPTGVAVRYVTPVRFSKHLPPPTELDHVTVTTARGLMGRPKGAGTMVMSLLDQHVPLSLLHDLWNPDGPESWEILAVENGWLDARSLDRSQLAQAGRT
jgi:hypothetical protein